VITGHIALGRTKRAPDLFGGRGLALAGLIMGYVSIGFLLVMVPIVAAIALPALAKAKGGAQEAACVNNMKQICLAARIYANDHGEKWPSNFAMMSNEISMTKILVCPADKSTKPASDWASFSDANVSYQLLIPGLDESKTSNSVPALKCRVHPNSTGYSDGSVQRSGRRRGGGLF
jgi:hypothetical protein